MVDSFRHGLILMWVSADKSHTQRLSAHDYFFTGGGKFFISFAMPLSKFFRFFC